MSTPNSHKGSSWYNGRRGQEPHKAVTVRRELRELYQVSLKRVPGWGSGITMCSLRASPRALNSKHGPQGNTTRQSLIDARLAGALFLSAFGVKLGLRAVDLMASAGRKMAPVKRLSFHEPTLATPCHGRV